MIAIAVGFAIATCSGIGIGVVVSMGMIDGRTVTLWLVGSQDFGICSFWSTKHVLRFR